MGERKGEEREAQGEGEEGRLVQSYHSRPNYKEKEYMHDTKRGRGTRGGRGSGRSERESRASMEADKEKKEMPKNKIEEGTLVKLWGLDTSLNKASLRVCSCLGRV